MKQEATENVLVALRRILRQELYLSERIANRMLRQLVSRGSWEVPQAPIARLSDRELEVFRLIGSGLGTRQIADELRISVKTVESYQAHIKEKLELQSSRDLVQHAIEWRMNELNEKKESAS
jgi:DNA-binding NarL/FixJ family response regulator